MFRGSKEAADLPKFCFSNLPITFWSLLFCCLSIFELCDLKLVAKRFRELVIYDIKFKRIFELTESMCEEVLWNKKIKENLLNFKQSVDAEFKDDLMLQLYIKHKVSSIFDKLNLCQYLVILLIVKESVIQTTILVDCVLECTQTV